MWVSFSSANLIIDIQGTAENRLPFTVLPFVMDSSLDRQEFEPLIANNLIKSGYFRFVDLGEAGKGRSITNVNYNFYRAANIEYVIGGRIKKMPSEAYELEFFIHDVLLRKRTYSSRWSFPKKSLRYSAHFLSDLTFYAIMDKASSFTSRLAYVHVNYLEDGGRTFSIVYTDSDGADPRHIVRSSMPLLSPAWSPDGRQIAYVSYENNIPEVFIHDIFSAKRRSIISFRGSNSSPAWSPDGERLVLSISKGGNPDIYEVDLVNKRLTQLTIHPGIDTEPVYDADGKSIIFTSNRFGKPTLFRLVLQNKQQQRVSKNIRVGYAASVAKNSDYIGFLDGEKGQFNIALYDKKNDSVDRLTQFGNNDSPTLSSNGLFILYSQRAKRKNETKLLSYDIYSRTSYTLKTLEGDVKNVSWGPPQDISPFIDKLN